MLIKPSKVIIGEETFELQSLPEDQRKKIVKQLNITAFAAIGMVPTTEDDPT